MGSVVATTPQYGAITIDVTSGGKFMVSHWRKGIIKQKDVAIVAGNT